MSYGNGIKLTSGFDVGAKTPLDSKSVVQTIAERDAFVTDNLVYEGLEVYVKDTGHKYRYNGTSWIDLDTQSGSESGTGEGLTTEQANQLTTAYEHSQTPHVSADDIPTKTSDLTNDSGFITSIPSEYITETELETKGYLTEHQSLTDYAKKTDIPDVSDFLTEVPTEYVTDTKLSTELDKKVNKEAGKGLSTNDLTNELVTKINSSATEAFVTNAIANAQLGGKEVDLSGYATVDALNLKADLTHTHDQYLTKVPDEYITETELTDKNYADKTYVTQAVKNVKVDLTGYAKTSDIPTKVSDLTNDSNFITSIPEEYITETELTAKKYLTSVPSTYALKTDIPTVPTKTSDLTNDSNFITSIPAEYITETELNAKGYLTSHQDISGLQTKTDDGLTTTDKTVIGAINELKTNISNINTGGGSSFSGSYNDLTDKPTIPTKTSDLNNDSGFIGYPDVIVIDKGDSEAEVDLDNDIPLGYNTILLTGRVVSNAYGHELVFVYRDRESSDSFTIYTMRGNRVVVNKSSGDWKITSSTSFIYRDSANNLYQKITDNTLTTTAKTIPTAINELKSGLNGIKVPTKTSELTNNSGFITTIPEEYITETELNAKGYLTSHQDISGLQTKTDNNLTTTSKEVVGAINEVKDMADLILDTEVRIDKTYSSSKIYSAIQDAIDSSKNFTLNEIGKMSGASYKVVTSTAEMTDGKIIYLLENGATYDMYITETAGTVTKIGDTTIDLSSYLKVTDAESAYLKKAEATSTYVAQTSFNNHITDTVAHLTQFEKNKLLTTDNITSTINNSSDNTQIPSAKATYDLANTKANTNHTHNASDIKGLSIPTLENRITTNETNITDLQEQTSDLQKQIDSLDIPEDVTGINNKLAELEKKRVYNSIGELNSAKGTNISLVVGEDNTIKIVDALSPIETFTDYFGNSINDNRFGIDTNTYGTDILLLTITKFNDNTTIIRAYMSSGKLLTRRHRNGVLEDWKYDGTGADVGVTTITPVNSNITGNIEYTVKNGICYVSMKDLMSTISSTKLSISTTMPKPSINCTALLVNASGNIAIIYINKDTTNLYGNFYTKNAKGDCSFSYPVAES